MEPKELIQEWQVGVRTFHIAHSKAASYYSRTHKRFGIPVIIVTTIVGTTVFATLESSTLLVVQICIGLLCIAATVLASLQTFLGYSELSERHKSAAFKYGVLRRQIEQLIALSADDVDELRSFVDTFRTKWDAADNESPIVPQRFFDRAREQVRKSMEAAQERKDKAKST